MGSNALTTTISMPSHNLLFTILLSLLFISTTLPTAFASSSSKATNSLKTYESFIKKACNSTTYPKECYNSLSPYASKIKKNPLSLTKISIALALKAARIADSTITKLSKLSGLTHSETLVLADCKENLDDSVDELEKSSMAMRSLNGTKTPEDQYQWANIKTWMSAAITDEDTCTDEFEEMEVRASLQKYIKTSVVNVERMISNSLALVNKLTY